MDPKDLPPPDADVWVAGADGHGIVRAGRASACDWLDVQHDDPDDEELAVTPRYVVDALGFDPKDPPDDGDEAEGERTDKERE